MSTIREIINTIEDIPVREKVFSNIQSDVCAGRCRKGDLDLDKEYTAFVNQADPIAWGFIWDMTPEGAEYWREIEDSMYDHMTVDKSDIASDPPF